MPDRIEMEGQSLKSGWMHLVKISASIIAGIFIIPFLIGTATGSPAHIIFEYVGSIFILQPVAAGIGLALGMELIPVLLIILSVGAAVILALFGICDLFADRSAWLRNRLDNVNAFAGRSALFKKYGILTLIPFIWVPGVGLYGCALLAWLFGWRDLRGIGIILFGWMLACLLVVGTTLALMGLIR